MTYKNPGFIIILAFYLFTGCTGGLIYTGNGTLMNQKEFLRHQQEYAPYKQADTIEGYNEFISRYPGNIFVKRAQDQTKRLEFEPYRKENTIESYLEFKILYPENPFTETANDRIEQTEIKRYEKMDTIKGYREFLKKYPNSIFSILPKKRLQELEFRKLGKNVEENYNFDLLLYRLKAKRIKSKLKTEGRNDLSNFVMFASFLEKDNKKYFNTYLIFPRQSSLPDISDNKTATEYFTRIISPLTSHLNNKFGAKHKIEGFSFDVSYSPHIFYGDRKVLFKTLFSLKDTASFAQKKISLTKLLAKSKIILPEKEKKVTADSSLKKSGTKKNVSVQIPKDGLKIMTMVNNRDKGTDHILSRSFKTVLNTGKEQQRKTIEKRVNLKGKKGFTHKVVIRNLIKFKYTVTDKSTIASMAWHYNNGKIARWEKYRRKDPVRIRSNKIWTPPQETYFCYNDIEIGISDEKHKFLMIEALENEKYYVVKSVPIKNNLKYSKRISWIDPLNLTTAKYEYYDKNNVLWQTIKVEWQNKFDVWFWKKAEIVNVRTGNKTLISVGDVRVNLGLPAQDFMLGALRKFE